MFRNARIIALAVALLAVSACGRFGGSPAGLAPASGQESGEAQTGSGASASRGGPRPYRQVIPERAITRDGMFRTHMVDERLYFEIPSEMYGREMLLIIRDMIGIGGPPNRYYTWERSGNRVQLWQKQYAIRAEDPTNLTGSVEAMAKGPLIASFNIEAFGADSAAVIEVTRLYTTNITEFGAIRGIVQDRSFVESATAFPDVVNVVATQTGVATPQGAPAGAQAQASTQRFHWSLALLPETPMMPRLHDSRVGFNSLSFTDYSSREHRSATRRYILRHRLEKADPTAAVSAPVEPIVYWVDRATPEWLIPYVLAGVKQWVQAFEEAGFSNAIEGRLAPSPEEDPDFSMFDARYSVIYWHATDIQNATGGGVPDPRSGEILKAEVNMYHNVQNLIANWYFTQVGPLDQRAWTLPLPDSLMGKLVEYVVAHEVGHSLGFPHNFKASSMYPADSLRDEDFLRRMNGHVATLMDYSRFNYVAQPEDGIPVELLIPQVGPYDRFAVKWGYAPVPGARTPDEEKPALDQLARMQDSIPWFRFTTPDVPNDPGQVTEAVGDAEAVYSSTLALRNLDRVMVLLIPAAEKPGEDYSRLQELYGNAVQQWGRYNGHVAAVIGGVESRELLGTGERFVPIPREKQREAMQWLRENAFATPRRFIRGDILMRIEPEGAVNRIRDAQASVLSTLISEPRIARLIDYEALDGEENAGYTVTEMMTEMRDAIWSELGAGSVRVDVYRRNLQRAHLRQIDLLLNPPRPPGQGTTAPPPPPPASDTRPVLRAELREIDRRAAAAQGRAGDAMTRIHLEDVRAEIARILLGG